MRVALAALAVLALAGCGSKKPDAYARANVALLDRLPVYPGARSPRTTTSGASSTEFAARDWALPASATATAVVRWYEGELAKRGWKIGGESFGTLTARKGHATVSLGVRGRTLEATANSRGA